MGSELIDMLNSPIISKESVLNSFNERGFLYLKDIIDTDEILAIKPIIEKFHHAWIVENKKWYEEKAINSAFLTRSHHLNSKEKLTLFQFISGNTINNILSLISSKPLLFLNTQLFFDPFDNSQNNYWHRDFQYHTSEEQQKSLLEENSTDLAQVIHIRIPLSDDPGVEIIPGSHNRWDSLEELDVRYGRKNRRVHDPLPNSKTQPLTLGDAFIFSANMIHRGQYGGNRLALDLIFFEPNKGVEAFVEKDCLPNLDQRKQLVNPNLFMDIK